MKKSSTVESFCLRNSSLLNYGSARYYESCVIGSKGTPFLCYVILTSDSLFVTKNPPSSLICTIPFAQITDVSLVADREALVRGGPNNNSYICQHVRISYEQDDINKSKKAHRHKKDPGHGHGTDSESRTSSGLEGLLEQDEDESLTHIPASIQRTFDPTYNSSSSSRFSPARSDDTKAALYGRRSAAGRNMDSETDSIRTDATRTTTGSTKRSSSSESPFRASSVIEQKLRSWRTGAQTDKSGENLDKTKRPSSVDISQLAKLRKMFGRKKEITTMTNGSGTQQVELRNRKSKSSSTHQEMNLYFYKPDSVFVNEIRLHWNRQLLSQPQPQPKDNNLQLPYPGKQFLTVARVAGNDLHTAELAFQRLRNDEMDGIQILFSKRRGKDSVTKILPVLRRLHRTMLKYDGLAYFCLKSSKLLTNLEVLLKGSLASGKKNEEMTIGTGEQKFTECRNNASKDQSNGNNNRKEFQLVLDKVSMHVLLLDIFRLLLLQQSKEAGGKTLDSQSEAGALISDDLIHARGNWQAIDSSQVLEVALYSIFAFPCWVEFDYDLKRLALSHGLELSRDVAKNYELIKLLSISHNISTSVLYDILIFAHYSPKDNAKRNVQILMNSFNLDSYLRQSMAQLINLFCSTQEILTFAQCTLIHRQFVVLTHLAQHSSSAKTFLRSEFCEEFRYFLNSETLNLKVPDEYPVKIKLSHACTAFRNLIIS